MRVLLFANVGTDDLGFYHVGDEAMFLQTYALYRTFLPHAEIAAFVSKPLNRALLISEHTGLPWPTTVRHARWYFLKLVCKLFILTRFGISSLSTEQSHFFSIIQQQDIVHCSGGGNITSETEHWLYYALLVIVAAYMFGKPVIATSQTIGPFHFWFDRYCAISILNRITILQLRNTSACQFLELKKQGLNRLDYTVSLDAAYGYKPTQVPISRSNSSRRLRIGLSFHAYKHTATQLSQIVRNLLRDIKKNYPSTEFVLLPHIMDRTNQWDLRFMQSALPKNTTMKITPITFSDIPKSGLEPAAYIRHATATCDVMLCSRYHAAVFALAESVPCVSIVSGKYQFVKSFNFFNCFFGTLASRFVYDYTKTYDRKALMETVQRVVVQRHPITSFLKRKNYKLTRNYYRYLKQLAAQILFLQRKKYTV